MHLEGIGVQASGIQVLLFRLGSPGNVWAGILAISFPVHTHGAAIFHTPLSSSPLSLYFPIWAQDSNDILLEGAGSSGCRTSGHLLAANQHPWEGEPFLGPGRAAATVAEDPLEGASECVAVSPLLQGWVWGSKAIYLLGRVWSGQGQSGQGHISS